jgi:hypothetical protein
VNAVASTTTIESPLLPSSAGLLMDIEPQPEGSQDADGILGKRRGSVEEASSVKKRPGVSPRELWF